MNIVSRMGLSPRARGSVSGANCPDVFRLASGDYLVIGRIADRSDQLYSVLKRNGASIGLDEMAVVVPADCMNPAARDIAQTFEPLPACRADHEETSP